MAVAKKSFANAVSWSSADTNVAVVDSSGKVVARGPGAATVIASRDAASATLTVNVAAPLLPASLDPIDPALATPATNALYEMPVVIINYLPTRDGVNVDNTILDNSTIAAFKRRLLLSYIDNVRLVLRGAAPRLEDPRVEGA